MIVILTTGERYTVQGSIEIREDDLHREHPADWRATRIAFFDVQGNKRIFDVLDIARIAQR